jgi:uncharacterized protein
LIMQEVLQHLDAFRQALASDDRIVFAYLYGSALEGGQASDVDIAVYARDGVDPFLLSADTALDLSRDTGIPPDDFDIRVINTVVDHGDVFGLLYLRDVFQQGLLLDDKDPDRRGDVLERFGYRYRECEGLIQEVLA